jgi:hypothetical protein
MWVECVESRWNISTSKNYFHGGCDCLYGLLCGDFIAELDT